MTQALLGQMECLVSRRNFDGLKPQNPSSFGVRGFMGKKIEGKNSNGVSAKCAIYIASELLRLVGPGPRASPGPPESGNPGLRLGRLNPRAWAFKCPHTHPLLGFPGAAFCVAPRTTGWGRWSSPGGWGGVNQQPVGVWGELGNAQCRNDQGVAPSA
jgi:hypothetical protein